MNMRDKGVASALALACATAAGCYGNDASAFPPGLEPWEENTAPMPTPTADDACPEVLSFGEDFVFHGQLPTGRAYHANAVHARGCIHQPMSVVWEAIQDPLVGKDQTTVNEFMVIDPPMPEECDGLYQSQINAGPSPFTVDFRLCWRMEVAEGTDDLPTLTATRWQKVWGSSALTVMEGSLVAHPLESDPSITVVEYQYHLDAVSSSAETIHNYLGVIYQRLVDRAHDRPLP
ncbi:MAG: hypothetical protein K1X94_20175 [Sandaracinaceae bacterium]|nr:hypothetical protein [Sandaracinaceae bacterium]